MNADVRAGASDAHDARPDAARPVVCLMGATAAGKTALALALARRLPVEIVSVDSAQVYRGLDIGSAKPDAATRAAVPHHLVDIREPTAPYSAAAFRDDALGAIAAIHARGRLPVLVGGTMLYFKALLEGIAELPSGDAGVRARLAADAGRLGWPALHARLAEVDPETAARVSPADRQRIQRALEVHALTGVAMSVLLRATAGGLGTDARVRLLQFAVGPEDRHQLDAAMAERFDAMLRDGLVEEVRHLLGLPGMHEDLPALRSVGYRQVCEYLLGRCDHATMRAQAVRATQHLAKRQYTWLRQWVGVRWLRDPARALDDLCTALASR